MCGAVHYGGLHSCSVWLSRGVCDAGCMCRCPDTPTHSIFSSSLSSVVHSTCCTCWLSFKPPLKALHVAVHVYAVPQVFGALPDVLQCCFTVLHNGHVRRSTRYIGYQQCSETGLAAAAVPKQRQVMYAAARTQPEFDCMRRCCELIMARNLRRDCTGVCSVAFCAIVPRCMCVLHSRIGPV